MTNVLNNIITGLPCDSLGVGYLDWPACDPRGGVLNASCTCSKGSSTVQMTEPLCTACGSGAGGGGVGTGSSAGRSGEFGGRSGTEEPEAEVGVRQVGGGECELSGWI
jgi:hypothetical protein